MKVFILLCIAFVSGLSANAQGIVFSNVSFEEALEKARQRMAEGELDQAETLTLVNEYLNPYVEDRLAEDLNIPA